MSPRRRRLADYYRQFEALSPQEDSERLRAQREEEKSQELARVGELDLSRPDWHEPPDAEIVNAATFALRRALNRYPDAAVWQAREAVARRHDVPVERVALGHGAGQLLQAALREVASGGEALIPWPSWSPLPSLAARAGARPVPVPLRPDGSPDLEAMAAAATDATRAVVLVSPNDPTGALVDREALRSFAGELRGSVAILLDEALVEFAGEDASCVPLTGELPNLLVLRSFSKAWAFAGLRGGYALGGPGDEELLAVLSPGQGVAAPAQAAIAAALADPHRAAAVLSRRRRLVSGERERLGALLADTPFSFTRSEAHVVWLRGEGFTAARVASALAEQRVVVAPGATWGDDDHVRITVRDRPATERLASSLRSLAR